MAAAVSAFLNEPESVWALGQSRLRNGLVHLGLQDIASRLGPGSTPDHAVLAYTGEAPETVAARVMDHLTRLANLLTGWTLTPTTDGSSFLAALHPATPAGVGALCESVATNTVPGWRIASCGRAATLGSWFAALQPKWVHRTAEVTTRRWGKYRSASWVCGSGSTRPLLSATGADAGAGRDDVARVRPARRSPRPLPVDAGFHPIGRVGRFVSQMVATLTRVGASEPANVGAIESDRSTATPQLTLPRPATRLVGWW